MALTHLIDTSVVTRLHLPAVRGQVAVLAEAEAIGRASITDLEVGFSARNAEEWDRLLAALRVFPLRARSARPRPAVTGQPTAWVVSAGSID